MKKRLALAVLVCLFTLLAQLESPSVPAQAAPTVGVAAQVSTVVDVNLLMREGPVMKDGTFLVLISLDPTHLVEIDVFQVFLTFDPTVFQLVSASATNDVEPGVPFATKRYKDVLTNSVDNSLGQVDFAGGAGPSGLATVGPFVAGMVKFRAIATATNTTIALSTVVPRQTKVLVGLNDVTGTLNGLSFPVTADTPLSDFFKILP